MEKQLGGHSRHSYYGNPAQEWGKEGGQGRLTPRSWTLGGVCPQMEKVAGDPPPLPSRVGDTATGPVPRETDRREGEGESQDLLSRKKGSERRPPFPLLAPSDSDGSGNWLLPRWPQETRPVVLRPECQGGLTQSHMHRANL